jgi:hypothetical protein
LVEKVLEDGQQSFQLKAETRRLATTPAFTDGALIFGKGKEAREVPGPHSNHV